LTIEIKGAPLRFLTALLAGLGLGLLFAWKVFPVNYVDAGPANLRADFKDQYRNLIAASYTTTHDLARARARLDLLGDADLVGALSAQAQRMLAAGESFDQVRAIAQLATDLQQGYAAIAFTSAPLPTSAETTGTETPLIEEFIPEAPPGGLLTLPTFEGTLLAPSTLITPPTARPTFTPPPGPGAPFTLIGQDPVCDPSLAGGLMQIVLMDTERRPVPGVMLIVTWDGGENRFFTGMKPELGNGYADFIMADGVVYSVRIVEGGAFVPDISPPLCTDPAGAPFRGGVLLTFQQP
jgi:hypothetical protein